MSTQIGGTTGITFPDATTQNTSPYTGGLAFRNRIINGAMMIDQRNAGAATTPASSTYNIDRWCLQMSQASKFTVQQNAGSVTPPAGFTNYLGFTVASAFTVGASDFFNPFQVIEGFNMADFGWGTSSAQTVTLSFWVRCSLTGQFSGSLQGSNSRSYPFNFTISSANTWEQKTVTIVGETTGTWNKTNGYGVGVYFNLGTGSTYLQPAGAWSTSASGAVGTTGSVNLVGTLGATFYITGVQLEKGSTATSFDYRPYGKELALCKRYYEKQGFVLLTSSGSTGYWESEKRASPTISLAASGGTGGTVAIVNYGAGTTTAFYQNANHSALWFSVVTGESEL